MSSHPSALGVIQTCPLCTYNNDYRGSGPLICQTVSPELMNRQRCVLWLIDVGLGLTEENACDVLMLIIQCETGRPTRETITQWEQEDGFVIVNSPYGRGGGGRGRVSNGMSTFENIINGAFLGAGGAAVTSM